MSQKSMEKIVALCKNRGYIYPGSEIYGGLANTWDYGPLGVEFKNNVKKAWMKKFVQENKYNVGLDSAILMNPQTWVASGHIGGFSDPLIDCKECKTRHRTDKLIEDWMKEHDCIEIVDGWSEEKMLKYISDFASSVTPWNVLNIKLNLRIPVKLCFPQVGQQILLSSINFIISSSDIPSAIISFPLS